MAKRYRIIVTEEEDVDVQTQEWLQHYDTLEQAQKAGKDSPYAYATKTEHQVRSTQIFDQRVDQLDLATVVKVVNKIQEPKPDGKPSKTKA